MTTIDLAQFTGLPHLDPEQVAIIRGLEMAAIALGIDATAPQEDSDAHKLALKLEPLVPRGLNVTEVWVLGTFLSGFAEAQSAATQKQHELALLAPVETV